MNKKYYWIIDGNYYEVSKENYQKYKKEYDRSKRLREYEAEVTVLSLDSPVLDEHTLADVIPDSNVNVEEEAIHKILLEKLKNAREMLSSDDKMLLELLYEEEKSQDEVAKITGIPQSTISYRLERILKNLRKNMGIKK